MLKHNKKKKKIDLHSQKYQKIQNKSFKIKFIDITLNIVTKKIVVKQMLRKRYLLQIHSPIYKTFFKYFLLDTILIYNLRNRHNCSSRTQFMTSSF